MIKTIEEINEKIRQGKAVVATAEEVIGIEFAKNIKELRGIVIIKDDDIGVWGEVKLCQTRAEQG